MVRADVEDVFWGARAGSRREGPDNVTDLQPTVSDPSPHAAEWPLDPKIVMLNHRSPLSFRDPPVRTRIIVTQI